MTNTPLLSFDQVSFCYPDGNQGLNQCSLAISAKNKHALIGVNGAGKTTLFQHANGLLKPQKGRVCYNGTAIGYNREGLRHLRSEVGLVFQNPDQQLFSASVEEDVSFGPLNLGLDMATVRERVTSALQAVGMAEFASRPVHNLSFGQKKRVCIAGVLAMRPRLLILDEPMAGLDYPMRQDLLKVLDDLHHNGITLVLATHDIDFAYRWANEIHLMHDGRCAASFPATEMAYEHNVAALTQSKLPVPAIIGLQQQLRRLGFTSLDDTQSRSTEELLAKLALVGTPPIA